MRRLEKAFIFVILNPKLSTAFESTCRASQAGKRDYSQFWQVSSEAWGGATRM